MIRNTSSRYFNFGMLVLRIGIGLSFAVFHGYGKIMGGMPKWKVLGSKMSVLGIDFLPEFWGFMAAFAEFFGAILLIIGLFTRPAAFLLAFTMLVAIMVHMNSHESYSHALEAFIVFIALLIAGPGKFSLDHIIKWGRK